MKILIIEDELPAYHKLFSLINENIKDVNFIGWARTKAESKILLEKNPDLIFSDIMLLDGISFDLFDEVKVTCPIIFCTAYDQYLFKAFQSNGIAYLLKPYNDEDFIKVYDKYRQLFETNENVVENKVNYGSIKAALMASTHSYKQRFTVKKNEGLKIVKIEEILLFEAQGDFSFIHTNNDKGIVNYALGQIELTLDPNKFFRINRSEIININHIQKIESYGKNKLQITLSSGQKVSTSESKTPDFRKWIDG